MESIIESTIRGIRDTDKFLSVPVKISHHEVDRIVVNRLISIRNFYVNERREELPHFDKAIRHFLDEDEFEKYVINEEEIEY
jgi:hypothetical protein